MKEARYEGQILYDSIYVKYRDRQIHRNRMQTGGCQRLEGSEKGKQLLNEYMVSFWDNKNVSNLDRCGGDMIP